MMREVLPAVLLAAACGDSLLVDPELEGPHVEAPAWEGVAPHFAPDVCTVRSWPSVAFADRDVDLTVVPTATGAAVFTVDRAGGPLRGFAIDRLGKLETDEAGTIVRDGATFVAVSAAFIDERLVTAAVSREGAVTLDVVRPDLGATSTLATARGRMVPDLPIAHVREQRFAPVAAATAGVTAIRFDPTWRMSGTQVLTAQAPRSITATRDREDMLVAWSTDATCHLARVGAARTSARDFGCVGARIAVNPVDREGFMVYESDGAVMIATIGAESEIANPRVLVEDATSPKIAFDGSRYWVSHLDAHQDVVVGYLGDDGAFVAMALEGTQPLGEAYDLAVISGGVWLFAVDGTGASAQRLCLRPVR